MFFLYDVNKRETSLQTCLRGINEHICLKQSRFTVGQSGFVPFFFLPPSLNSLPSSSPTPPLCPTEHILHFQGMETCLNHTDSQIKFNIFLQDIHDMQIPEGLFLIHMKVPYAREIRALSY